MKNKFIKFFILLFLLLPKNVLASDGIVARIGDNYYDLLSAAIDAAGSDDVIKLTSSITLRDTQNINKSISKEEIIDNSLKENKKSAENNQNETEVILSQIDSTIEKDKKLVNKKRRNKINFLI